MEGKGWVKVKDLQVGDSIRKADGSTGKITSVKTQRVTQAMYDLTVKDAHSFYVGQEQWLVHNVGCGDWKFGEHHSPAEWEKYIRKRGWTPDQINEAIGNGESFPTINNVHPENTATLYIYPDTGRSVVVDDMLNIILHLGGDGFLY